MNKHATPKTVAALQRAIDVMGSQAALGAVCGKTQGHVSYWLRAGIVPSDYCPSIERATRERGEVVFCECLHPAVPWGELRGHAFIEQAVA